MVIVETHRPNLPPEASKSLMEGFRRRAGSHLRDPLELLAERNPAAPLDQVVKVTVTRELGAITYRYRFRDGTRVTLTVPNAEDLILEVGGRPVYAHLMREESLGHPHFWHEVAFFSEDWKTQYLLLTSPKISAEEVLDAARSMLEGSPHERHENGESAASSLLSELIEMEERGLDVYEMLNVTLVEIRNLTWQLIYLTDKLSEESVLPAFSSSGGTFVVRVCPPPDNLPSDDWDL